MGLISEFKEFALKGNVVDMAIGVIISDLRQPYGQEITLLPDCRHACLLFLLWQDVLLHLP